MKIHRATFPQFQEFVDFLNYADNIPRRDLPVSINFPHDPHEQCIVYNIEELTRSNFSFNLPSNVVELWDFSLANIKILNDHGITNTRHVPFKLWDSYRSKIESYNPNQIYEHDVTFVGWLSGRRNKILQELIDAGVNINVLTNMFGEERDRLIAKSRILLNIHYEEDYKIFETYRCFAWLETGKTIVTENSLDNDSRCINVDYDDLVNTVLRVLEN